MMRLFFESMFYNLTHLFDNSYATLCEKAFRAVKAHRPAKAGDFCVKAIKRDPKNPQAYDLYAMAFHEAAQDMVLLGDDRSARDQAEKGIQCCRELFTLAIDADHKAEVLWRTGEFFAIVGDTEKQYECWDEADRIKPGYMKNRLDRNKDMMKDAIVAAKRG